MNDIELNSDLVATKIAPSLKEGLKMMALKNRMKLGHLLRWILEDWYENETATRKRARKAK